MSTFTDWNGPQTSSIKTSDLLALINAYDELKKKVEAHITERTVDNNVHSSRDYTDAEIAELKKLVTDTYVTGETLVTSLSTYAKNSALDNYAKNSALDNYAKSAEVEQTYAKIKTLNNYIETEKLIDGLFDSLDALKTALSGLTKIESQLSTDDAGNLKAKMLEVTTKLHSKLISATTFEAEQVLKFNFLKFTAPYVGLGDDKKPYYLLGMLDNRAGTAYIRYTNTSSFAAVIDFAVTYIDTEYTNGQLSITTDIPTTASDILKGLKYNIVVGTDANGTHHAYLAIQTDKLIDAETNLMFEGAGINFYPVGSTEYIAPNGVVTETEHGAVTYYSLQDRITNLEEQVTELKGKKAANLGTITLWGKIDTEGNPTGFDATYYHICDGSEIGDEADVDLKVILGTNYPLIDYSIIRIKE